MLTLEASLDGCSSDGEADGNREVRLGVDELSVVVLDLANFQLLHGMTAPDRKAEFGGQPLLEVRQLCATA